MVTGEDRYFFSLFSIHKPPKKQEIPLTHGEEHKTWTLDTSGSKSARSIERWVYGESILLAVMYSIYKHTFSLHWCEETWWQRATWRRMLSRMDQPKNLSWNAASVLKFQKFPSFLRTVWLFLHRLTGLLPHFCSNQLHTCSVLGHKLAITLTSCSIYKLETK